ncbi:MAG: competence/damage-inducible protein A [Pelagibacteraceae bacterium]|jgi:molybdenum cofactor synthesis domain-containing protein|nr:competence/damage-inducible protein A [Pelagibacteraceae bacterium]MDP6784675.1 competence/damage-inducible protein A [Alphaproteobacteria bacterium]MBO6466939.1 competence/damage-inducible protein A [Pelagibacteraceae bacterium]MBO6467439.1 competence/damage-inducible protein A [Pelagibacteraceae bacterium]MBO6470529.1 competence/damage-inducible protein A [Pelagibacteraceae bacterium]|tara:strand:- start:9 stop:755 length:747 start_codon:yes stop_codon:yes gene_type:complete
MTNLTAGLIIIGDEILSGRTQDTNSNFIANKLVKAGIKLEQIRTIQDNQKTIIDTVKAFHKSYTYVFTTGGIGPTHDDITSESIAIAFNKEFCFHKEAFKILEDYYPKGEFNEGRKKMAKMPESSELILNPLTVCPGFRIENVFVFPGVPEIMKKMFVHVLKNIQKGEPKKIITISTNLYESLIAEKLSIIQEENPKCSIGSYPYFNHVSKIMGVNIVISSWKLKNLDNIADEIEDMISLLNGKSKIV